MRASEEKRLQTKLETAEHWLKAVEEDLVEMDVRRRELLQKREERLTQVRELRERLTAKPGSPIRVSEHALLRYAEHTGAFDRRKAEAMLSSKSIQQAASLGNAQDCKVKIGDGMKAIIRNNTVVTVVRYGKRS